MRTRLRFDAVLFDLDNTLADRTGAFRRWVEAFVSGRLGIHQAAARRKAADLLIEWDRSGNADRAELFSRITAEWPGIGQPVPELVAEYEREYPRMFRPDPRVTRLVQALGRRGIRWGIVTNGGRTQRPKIENIGLAGLTECIVVSGEVGVAKPERRIFDIALELAGSPDRRRTLFVGDSPVNDMGGAREAGMGTAWVSNGGQWPQGLPSPDYAVRHVSEVGLVLQL